MSVAVVNGMAKTLRKALNEDTRAFTQLDRLVDHGC